MDDIRGLSDSPSIGRESQAKCDRCGATTRLDKGTCVSCLLLEGLQAEGEASSETFENVLEESGVPDKEWRLGNYEIIEEIGRGGMGVIYRARQRHSRRIVAVKRLLSYQADSHETLVRFRREAEAAASLDHPNILPIYEVSESEDGRPFFSMKFAPGGSLGDAGASFLGKPRECVRLMAKVARAIECAHVQGILHRDLKPGNILLDGSGEPLVIDFGLAKWLEANSDLTRTLTTFGTPGYIAPEQAESAAGDLTPAADIYSLGAILFELLTGRPPFLGANALSVIRQAAEAPAPKLRSLARSLGRDLETICARCLEREPAARYRSAAALAEDLEHWLHGRPIVARPVSPPSRLWRWSRRNPILATAAMACLLLSSAVTWLWVAQAVTAHRIAAPEKSIAVLPFENVENEEKNIVFTEEMQKDISTQLTRLPELRVISGGSVQQYMADAPRDLRGIGKALGVRHVLDGRVRRAAGRVEVSTRLVDATTGAQIWAEHYDGDVPQSLNIQGAVAQAIANQLRANLSPAQKAALEHRVDAEVKATALCREGVAVGERAWYDQRKENWLRCERLLNEATQLDPNCINAYSTLILVEWNLWRLESGERGARLRRNNLAKEAFENMVRTNTLGNNIQFNEVERHEEQSYYYYYIVRDFEKAAQEWEIWHPNTVKGNLRLAMFDRRRGRWTDSIRRLAEYEQDHPNTAKCARETVRTLLMMRRYAEAEQFLKGRLPASPDADPDGLGRLRLYLCELRLAEGDAPGANELFPDAASWHPDIQSDIHSDRTTTALCARDYNLAKQLADSAPGLEEGNIYTDPTPGLKLWYQAQIARAQHGAQSAQPAFVAARNDAGLRWGDSDAIPKQLSLLACMDAGAGHKDDAIREARRALEMWPIARDAMDGPYLAENLALVYAWTGERDLAIEQLEALAKIPCGPSYGDLKLNPKWDDLRGDPRFEEMVASLTPKP